MKIKYEVFDSKKSEKKQQSEPRDRGNKKYLKIEDNSKIKPSRKQTNYITKLKADFLKETKQQKKPESTGHVFQKIKGRKYRHK